MAAREKTIRSKYGRPGEKVKVLITRDRIHRRILEIAKQIRGDFPEEPLLLVGVSTEWPGIMRYGGTCGLEWLICNW